MRNGGKSEYNKLIEDMLILGTTLSAEKEVEKRIQEARDRLQKAQDDLDQEI